jgi:hypothetical protein
MPKKSDEPKMGRPPRAGKLATKRIEIRVTEDEHELLTGAAGDENLATWARAVLLRSAKKEAG